MEDYSQWGVRAWQSPWDSARGLTLVSLVDDGELRITLENVRSEGRPRWQVICPEGTYPAYRNVLEDVRVELWKHLDKNSPGCGPLFEVAVSPWLNAMRASEPLFDVKYGEARHWVITTEDDVVEILATEEPRIVGIEAAKPGSPLPGKSDVMYYPADKAKLREALPHWPWGDDDA